MFATAVFRHWPEQLQLAIQQLMSLRLDETTFERPMKQKTETMPLAPK